MEHGALVTRYQPTTAPGRRVWLVQQMSGQRGPLVWRVRTSAGRDSTVLWQADGALSRAEAETQARIWCVARGHRLVVEDGPMPEPYEILPPPSDRDTAAWRRYQRSLRLAQFARALATWEAHGRINDPRRATKVA